MDKFVANSYQIMFLFIIIIIIIIVVVVVVVVKGLKQQKWAFVSFFWNNYEQDDPGSDPN